MTAKLGEFEMIVALAVMHLGDNAYGNSIREDIERRSLRKVSRGAVYATLDRLEEKGLISSRFGDPTPARGGRAKRLFRVEERGLEALGASKAVLERMWHGLEHRLEGR
jgi:DNA-binding PadR family transcriptional regulator